MDVDELIARECIRDLVARYNSTGDSGRFDEMMALFTPDAVLEVEGTRHEGQDAIRALFSGTKESVAAHAGAPTYLRHCTATLQIDLTSSSTATARCYFFVLMAHGLDHWGRYVDAFEGVDGGWRFTSRRITLDGYVEGGFAGSRDRG